MQIRCQKGAGTKIHKYLAYNYMCKIFLYLYLIKNNKISFNIQIILVNHIQHLHKSTQKIY